MSMQGTDRSSYGRRPVDGEQGAAYSRRMLLLSGAAGGALALAGCSTPPPPKPIVTPIAMTLVAGADVNPDVRARPSPLTVRIGSSP